MTRRSIDAQAEVPTAELQAVLRNATALMPRVMTQLPILSTLLLEFTPGRPLQISLHDYDISLRQQVPMEYGGLPASVAVRASTLAAATRLHDAGPTDKTLLCPENDRRVTILQGELTARLPSLLVEDFPELPAVPEATARLSGEQLHQLATRTVIAAGRDDTLPVLTAVAVAIADGQLEAAATDRYRMAVVEHPADGDLGRCTGPAKTRVPAQVLIPARLLQHAARLFRAAPQVDVGYSGTGLELVSFAAAGTVLTGRPMEGQFPDYQKLLPGPDAPAEVATLPRQALQRALAHVRSALVGTAPAILRFDLDRLQVLSGDDSQDVATAAATVTDTGYTGAPFQVAFNPLYLLDGLRAIPDEKIMMRFSGDDADAHARKPMVMCGSNPGFRYLLMPVRRSG